MKTNILTAVLLVAAIGVCSGYAQTVAPSASFPLPGRSASDAPYEFRTDKSDGGINVSFTLNNVERVIIDSVIGKSRISVPGLSSTTFAGLPALPYKSFRIAPEGSGTPQIIVRDSTYIDCPINLDHNPEIRYDSIGQPQFIEVARIDYSGFMPSDLARVTDTQIYRDRPIYTITIMPMKYNRATGMLRIFTSLDIDIEYTVQAQTYANAPTRSAAFNAYTDRMLTEALGVDAVLLASDRPMVETQSIIGDKNPGIEPGIDPIIDLNDITEDMLVISRGDFRAATDSLKEWKKNLGYRVHVVEDWNWTQAKVDSVIKCHYRFDRNLTTVLIMGTDAIVPGYSIKERNPNATYWSADKHDSSTDYPYMCLDASNDRYPDVVYGRLLVYCTSQANEAVSKIIKYERGLYSSPNIYNKAFLATRYWWDEHNGRFLPTLEDIHSILNNNNINAQRIYTTDSGRIPTTWDYQWNNRWNNHYTDLPSYLQYPQYPWNATSQDISNAFISGVNLAVYNGHGGCDRWSGFPYTDEDFRQISFYDSAPLIFSIGCSTANHTLYHNCIVAEMSSRGYGGIAVIASTNVTKLGYSDALLLGMIDAIWPNSYSYLGWTDPIQRESTHRLYDILNNGLNRVEETQGGGYWDEYTWDSSWDRIYLQYQRESFHVFGDPTVNYNTEAPSIYANTSCISSSNTLSVSIDETNLPAKVVVKNLRTGAITTHKVTKTSGLADYQFAVTPNDSLEVVVSGPNKIPYRQIVVPQNTQTVPKGKITNVSYDNATQTAIVTYTVNVANGMPSFVISDIYSNTYTPLVAIGPEANQRTLYLSDMPNGMLIITLLIDGEASSIYKLIKN